MNNVLISRIFNAPRQLVFDCFVKPEHFAKWGLLPAGCTPTLRHADVRPGGHYIVEQNGPDGAQIFAKFVFREIDPIDRLVMVTSLCTEKGEIASNPSLPLWPHTLLATVVFEEEGPGTRVSVQWEPLDAPEEHVEFYNQNSHFGKGGWSESLDRVERLLQELSAAE